MGERLSDIRAHIVAMRQLETVITAMRGVAAARMVEAQSHLEGVRAYARQLGEAMSLALTLAAEAKDRTAPVARPPSEEIVLAFGSAQGFVGGYNERVLAAARNIAATSGRTKAVLFIVGERGATLAAEQGLEPVWTTPMASHVDETPSLADRIADALYDRIGESRAARVTLIHGAPAAQTGPRLVERPLIPLDLARFPLAREKTLPLVTRPPETLIASLAQEYVFAELCEAVVLSFAAENEARVQAMISARSNVRKSLDELQARHRRQRQEEITEEIIELVRR